MTPKDSAARVEFSFSIDGLTAREDLLFRSFMRVVTKTTLQSWLYKPLFHSKLENFKADLRVITEDKIPREVSIEGTWPPMIVMGYIERHKTGFMSLPINPMALESELNRQGILLKSASAHAISSGHVLSKKPDNADRDLHESLRLLRWPPPRLLGSPQRIQLATLMAGQALTLASLQNRSRQPVQSCKDFVVELEKAGLLYRWTDLQPAPNARESKKSPLTANLITRIRNRLGLLTGSKN